MSTTTENDRNVKLMQRRMNAELKTLKDAISDPNALMSSGVIFSSLERMKTLQAEYSEIAWNAHTAWLERSGL